MVFNADGLSDGMHPQHGDTQVNGSDIKMSAGKGTDGGAASLVRMIDEEL